MRNEVEQHENRDKNKVHVEEDSLSKRGKREEHDKSKGMAHELSLEDFLEKKQHILGGMQCVYL